MGLKNAKFGKIMQQNNNWFMVSLHLLNCGCTLPVAKHVKTESRLWPHVTLTLLLYFANSNHEQIIVNFTSPNFH